MAMVPLPEPCGKLSGAAATMAGLALTMCSGQPMAVTVVSEEATLTHGAVADALPGRLGIMIQAGCCGSGSGLANSAAFRRTLVTREASHTTTGVTPLALAVQ